MTRFDDYSDDMRAHPDDERFEALLAGRDIPDGDAAHLRAVVAVLRSHAAGPVPRPSEALAAVLTQGAALHLPGSAAALVAVPAASRPQSRRVTLITKPVRRLAAKVGGLSLAAHLALGAGVALAGVGAAGAAGVLPPGPPSGPETATAAGTFMIDAETGTARSEFGQRVSDDAKGLDGAPGVDGEEISEEAKTRFRPNGAEGDDDGGGPPEDVPGPPEDVPGPPEDVPGPPDDLPAGPPEGVGPPEDAGAAGAGPPADPGPPSHAGPPESDDGAPAAPAPPVDPAAGQSRGGRP